MHLFLSRLKGNKMRIPEFIRKLFLAYADRVMKSREPDFIIRPIGHPQTLRWHIIPRNELLNIYIHKWVASDDDRAPHDHPYHNASILLRGSYIEHVYVPEDKRSPGSGHEKRFFRKEGHLYIRKATAGHRVELMAGEPKIDMRDHHDGDLHFLPSLKETTTLFITGPRFRDWGFFCANGWVHEDKYRDKRDKGMIGKGCDQ